MELSKHKPSHHGRRDGFTLVEAAVGMLILATVFTALFGAIGQGINMIEHARDLTRSSQVLQSEMETLRTWKWTELQAKATASNQYSYDFYFPDSDFGNAYNNKYRIARRLFYTDATNELIEAWLWVGYTTPEGYRWRRVITQFTEDGLNDFYYRNV